MSATTFSQSPQQQPHTEPDGRVSIRFQALGIAEQQHLSADYWRWLELFDRDPEARITQHPDYLFAEVTNCVEVARTDSPRTRTARAKAARPLVLCEMWQGQQLVALGVLVPKLMTTRQAGGFGWQKTFEGYRLAGNRFLGTANCEWQRQLLSACATFVREQDATYLLIEDLEQSDPLFAAAESLHRDGFRIYSPSGLQERLKIEFPPQADEYWKKFSSKTRNTFRRKQKKIGASRLVRVTEPGQVAEFLEAAHGISQRTWQSAQLGLRIRNDDTEAQLFTFLAIQHALRSYLLYVDERPIAFLIGTQFRGHFSYEEVGYDRDFADRSPGLVLLLHVLDDLLTSDPPRRFDFGGGEADYKKLFATTTSTSGSVWLVPPGLRPQFWLGFLRGCRMTDQFARIVIRKVGLTTWFRQLIRGKRATLSLMPETDHALGDSPKNDVDVGRNPKRERGRTLHEIPNSSCHAASALADASGYGAGSASEVPASSASNGKSNGETE